MTVAKARVVTRIYVEVRWYQTGALALVAPRGVLDFCPLVNTTQGVGARAAEYQFYGC
jgi:hypothetical protein